MGKYALKTACVLGLLFIAPLVFAADWTNLFVDISVPSICQIDVSGGLTLELVAPAAPGLLPADDVDTSTTYAISSNNTAHYKITGQVSTMPDDRPLQLKCTMAAPTGATSGGEKTWDLNNDNGDPAGIFDMVTDIDATVQSGMGITWTLHCTAQPLPVWKNMTFTIQFIAQ